MTQELVQHYIAAYNAFDIDGMAALLADNIRFENYSGGALTAQTDGLASFRELAEQSRGMFSTREQRVTGWSIGENTITVDIDYNGTLAQDIAGGPSAGTVLSLQGSSEFAFGGGKITRITDRS